MSYVVPFEVPELSYEEACSQVKSALRFGIGPTLDTTIELLKELGNPDLAFESLQIAGTNGKTSTARYAAAILRALGYRTALYTSPELVRYVERMEVSGESVSEDAFARGISASLAAAQRLNLQRERFGLPSVTVTEFELLTVAACVVYAEVGVDVAVLEVGMGGRWDATSAVRSIRTVSVTGIGLDHMHILGDTIEAIASEKAAVIKNGVGCTLGAGVAVSDSVVSTLLEQCKKEGVTPIIVRPVVPSDAPSEMIVWPSELKNLPHADFHITQRPSKLGGSLEFAVETPRFRYDRLVAQKPSYQAANIACALTMVERHLGGALDLASVRLAVEGCSTPGRFEVLRQEPLVLVDACHNPQSVKTFLRAVCDIAPEVHARPTLLMAALADKDARQMVDLLATQFEHVVVCQTSSYRAMPAEELADMFRSVGVAPKATCRTVGEAISLLSNESFVACGSITLVGDIYACITRALNDD